MKTCAIRGTNAPAERLASVAQAGAWRARGRRGGLDIGGGYRKAARSGSLSGLSKAQPSNQQGQPSTRTAVA